MLAKNNGEDVLHAGKLIAFDPSLTPFVNRIRSFDVDLTLVVNRWMIMITQGIS